jgi:EAL domain-containing protein (putative c-di-GMP-specific phosphodiesterase class I)
VAVLDLELVPALARAVEDDQLQVHYQPEIDLASGSVVGMEALLRWAHPRRGLLWPENFLGVARATGLLDDIGRWLVNRCAAEAQTWSELPPVANVLDRQLLVNISAGELLSPCFADDLLSAVTTHGLQPGTFGIEVSASALRRIAVGAPETFDRLRAAGVLLAIDDVQAWSDLEGEVGELPLDIVKIDIATVRWIGRDSAAPGEFEDTDPLGVLRDLIERAHERELLVVAEGIESWTESALLCDVGCDRAHGFLFAGPQQADRARAMLATGTGWSGLA